MTDYIALARECGATIFEHEDSTHTLGFTSDAWTAFAARIAQAAPADDLRAALGKLVSAVDALERDPNEANTSSLYAALDSARSALEDDEDAAALSAAPSPDRKDALAVVMDLLRECVGPLEVSAAVIESDDDEHMEALIDKVKRVLDQYDAARQAPKEPEA